MSATPTAVGFVGSTDTSPHTDIYPGYALQGSSESGYCDDEEWLALFNGCLECALEYDIWRHYGGGLTPAAEACGLDATPVPVEGGDDETTTTAPPAEETTSAAEETSAAETTVADETSAAEETSPAEETSAAEETSPAEETSAVEETTVAEPTPEPTTAVETVTESWITSTPANTIPGDSVRSPPNPLPFEFEY